MTNGGKIFYRWSGLLRLALVALIVLMVGCKANENESAPPPPTVEVTNPVLQRVTSYLDFTGNTAATNSVTLVARVEGYLEKIYFTDGAWVHKGDLLFVIQRDQYLAQLQKAEAEAEAQRASLWHATTEFKRYSGLFLKSAATQTQVDQWHYQRDAAAAALMAAEAQIALAKLNLSYTEVKAPFDGRIGRHLINPGNLVGAAGKQSQLAEINGIDPIYVYFTINERDLSRILARNRELSSRPVNEQAIPVYYGLTTDDGYPRRGRLDFASISVAPTTGTLQLRGIFPNPDHTVLPGLFVHVRVPERSSREALLIPGEAVNFDQQGQYVLVVNEHDIVERRAVKTGAQVGTMLVIEDGLKSNDRVVVAGLLQAIPGRKVNPQPVAAASPAATASAHKAN